MAAEVPGWSANLPLQGYGRIARNPGTLVVPPGDTPSFVPGKVLIPGAAGT
jgi:hypothetical protein